MNLENKERVEFVDAHLWAAGARFQTSVKINDIPNFFGLLSDIKMTTDAHLENSSSQDYYVSVEFVPVVMEPRRTESKILQLIAICCQLNGSVNIILDGTGAKLDANGNIMDRWSDDQDTI